MTTFRICVAGRNHEEFTEQCIASVLAQKGDFILDWTDDASRTDAAYQIAERMLRAERHIITRRPWRHFAMFNLWRAMHRAEDDEVCVLLGGDDWLDPWALERIAKEYEDPTCWCTYGQLHNDVGPASFCSYEWDGTDPRMQAFLWAPFTMRAKLAKKVVEDDLLLNGSFFQTSGDVALNIPIIEMAGHDRSRFIPDAWYNRHIHAGNDHNVNGRFQDFCSWEAMMKPRYSRLETMDDAPVRTPHTDGNSIIFTPKYLRGHFVAY